MTEYTTDYLLDKKVQISQPVNGFRTGMDAVILAMISPALQSGQVLDMGCGVGSVGLCYATRCNDSVHITGIDKEPIFLEYAQKNIKNNGLQNRMDIVQQDIAEIRTQDSILRPDSFDMVLTNPPFEEQEKAYIAHSDLCNVANIESSATCNQWLAAALHLAKPRGNICIIHKMERLHDILHALYGKVGDIQILPIATHPNGPPKRVLIVCRKLTKTGVNLLPPLIMKTQDGQNTPIADSLLCGDDGFCLEKTFRTPKYV